LGTFIYQKLHQQTYKILPDSISYGIRQDLKEFPLHTPAYPFIKTGIFHTPAPVFIAAA
jgi:hypothetical protein